MPNTNLLTRVRQSIVSSAVRNSAVSAEITRRVNLAVRALDDIHDRSNSDPAPRDRREYDRMQVLRDALSAWRSNALARRIVELTSQYVVGGGLGIHSDDAATHLYLQAFWDNRLNRMATRAYEWCDELTRAGELYIVLSTDAGGMSYVRAIPALEITAINTQPNDIEQELAYEQLPAQTGDEPTLWHAYDEANDAPDDANQFAPVMLHYFVNRPVGAKHGESDLAPLLVWLYRYETWLEDRVRLNHFRQSFIYRIKRHFSNQAERLARQAEVNSNPPSPGSVLVTDDLEEWDVLHPKLDSFEAGEDGLAIKKMIAAGSGNPLHFLAEPESSTRTTAEQAGGPTFRHYEQRQIYFRWIVADVCRIAARRRALVDERVRADAPIEVRATDIFARDNASLAAAAVTIINAFLQLRDRQLIDDAELLRLAYKFAGEVVDVPALLAAGKKAPPTTPTDAPIRNLPKISVQA